MLVTGCQGASSQRRNLSQELISTMEEKYGDKFTILENAGGGSGMSEHCALFVGSDKLPDDKIYAVHGVFDGKSGNRDNYMAYYLRKEEADYLTKLASGVYGDCKAFCKPDEKSLLPESINKSSSAEDVLRSTKMYVNVVLPPQSTADKDQKLDKMFYKLKTEKINCYFYIAYFDDAGYYKELKSFEGVDKSHIKACCTLGMDDGFNIVERQWG